MTSLASRRSASDHSGLPRPLTFLVVGMLALFSAACSTHGSGPSRLATAELVAPPMGVFQFCVERLEECGIVETAVKADQGEKSDDEPTPRADIGEPMTDEQALAIARRINAEINMAITYRTDLELWGRDEAWLLPISDHGVAYGDCEDYVLEKRRALIEVGVPEDRLAIATVWSEFTGFHAVLVLRTADNDYVLDNATPHILTVAQTEYEWRSLQVGRNLLEWARVDGTVNPAGSAPVITAG